MAKRTRNTRKAKSSSTYRRKRSNSARNNNTRYVSRPKQRVRKRAATNRGRDRNITITLVQQPAGGVNDQLAEFAAAHNPQKPHAPKRARF